jgi:F-type H+-transporting ATPase subunit a
MADPILHIKDSYYFEVPKVLYPYDYKSARQFPEVWVSLDPEFQEWEFARLYQDLSVLDAGLPPKEVVQHDWHHWLHADHANFAKPGDVFLDEKYQAQLAKFNEWKAGQITEAQKKNDGSVDSARRLGFTNYIDHLKTQHSPDEAYLEFLGWRHDHPANFQQAKEKAGDKEAIGTWKQAIEKKEIADWSKEKVQAYNNQLAGKILIPQPFGTLRNLYEKESGFAISKFMLIEVFVGLILVMLFYQLGQRVAHGRPPRGKFWNLLEVFLVFIRDQIARPVFGAHDHGHEEEHVAAAHAEHSHGHDPHDQHGHEPVHAHSHAHAAHYADPAGKYLPLLWTIFFFVLGCNLMGMVPWAGSPTAAWSVTLAIAAITFFTVWATSAMKWGLEGVFFLNTIPGMELPWYMAIVLKPMIFLIELLGLVIKHVVLSVRLLANMVAGHLVILGVMGLAFGAQAALYYTAPTTPGWQWWLTATIAVVGAAAFNLLELFVAFLQAYIFTFLTALFIGSVSHKH